MNTRNRHRPVITATRYALAALVVLAVTSGEDAHADRRYRIYRSTPFGFPENALRPDAVLEVDRHTGRGVIYEADTFGNPDTIEGPKYIIEAEDDSRPGPLFRSRSRLLRELEEPCDDDDDDFNDTFRNRRRRSLFDE